MAPSGYSIGKQPKKPSFFQDNHLPGVGTYDSSKQNNQASKKRAPVYSIGRSARLKVQKLITQNIGPNSYDLDSTSFFHDRKRGFSMIGKKKQRMMTDGPGPGSYDRNQKLYSTKYYSFGMKTQQSVHQKKPGPGDYELDTKKNSCAISFELSKRPDIVKNTQALPGPGSYNFPEHEQTKKNKFSFSRTQKFFQQTQEQQTKKFIPAPNNYLTNINQVKKRVISQKFGKNKRQSFRFNQFPGPAAYTTSNTPSKRSPVATFGNSPKHSNRQQKTPGPGQYSSTFDILKRKSPNIVIGKSSQMNSPRQKSPGPGQYNIDTYKPVSHCYSISGRNSKQKKQVSPDPGCYDIKYNSVYRRPETSIIGKAQKFLNKIENRPGPTDYNVDFRSSSKSFVFPKQQKKQIQSTSPGPGAYDLNKTNKF